MTETALATALNTSFFAERVATFAIVMGFALFLIGHWVPGHGLPAPLGDRGGHEAARHPGDKVAAGTA